MMQEQHLCDHRPTRPVHRPHLRHGNLSPWAPPPPGPTDLHVYPLCHLKCHCCPSEYCHFSAVLLSKSWGCLMMCELLAPREGTASAPHGWVPFPSQSTSVGTARQGSRWRSCRMLVVHRCLDGKSTQMQLGVFSITSAAKDVKRESLSLSW